MIDRRFVVYNLIGTDKPWVIIILDFEWIDDNRLSIETWFDLNAADVKSNLECGLIYFTNEQYTMWCMTWDIYRISS